MWPVIANSTNLWQDVEFVDVSFLQSNLAPNLCINRWIKVFRVENFTVVVPPMRGNQHTVFGGHIPL